MQCTTSRAEQSQFCRGFAMRLVLGLFNQCQQLAIMQTLRQRTNPTQAALQHGSFLKTRLCTAIPSCCAVGVGFVRCSRGLHRCKLPALNKPFAKTTATLLQYTTNQPAKIQQLQKDRLVVRVLCAIVACSTPPQPINTSNKAQTPNPNAIPETQAFHPSKP